MEIIQLKEMISWYKELILNSFMTNWILNDELMIIHKSYMWLNFKNGPKNRTPRFTWSR